jgi:hypothetical protein
MLSSEVHVICNYQLALLHITPTIDSTGRLWRSCIFSSRVSRANRSIENSKRAVEK